MLAYQLKKAKEITKIIKKAKKVYQKEKILRAHYSKTMMMVFQSKVLVFYIHGESCYWTYSFEIIVSVFILVV
ncbi:hypothetical protein BAR153v2_011010 [Bartonella sp. AR 15-3]|nr:hypothetical protein BAR153v2_011010 [Bartonella sp. AR 15-3]